MTRWDRMYIFDLLRGRSSSGWKGGRLSERHLQRHESRLVNGAGKNGVYSLSAPSPPPQMSVGDTAASAIHHALADMFQHQRAVRRQQEELTELVGTIQATTTAYERREAAYSEANDVFEEADVDELKASALLRGVAVETSYRRRKQMEAELAEWASAASLRAQEAAAGAFDRADELLSLEERRGEEEADDVAPMTMATRRASATTSPPSRETSLRPEQYPARLSQAAGLVKDYAAAVRCVARNYEDKNRSGSHLNELLQRRIKALELQLESERRKAEAAAKQFMKQQDETLRRHSELASARCRGMESDLARAKRERDDERRRVAALHEHAQRLEETLFERTSQLGEATAMCHAHEETIARYRSLVAREDAEDAETQTEEEEASGSLRRVPRTGASSQTDNLTPLSVARWVKSGAPSAAMLGTGSYDHPAGAAPPTRRIAPQPTAKSTATAAAASAVASSGGGSPNDGSWKATLLYRQPTTVRSATGWTTKIAATDGSATAALVWSPPAVVALINAFLRQLRRGRRHMAFLRCTFRLYQRMAAVREERRLTNATRRATVLLSNEIGKLKGEAAQLKLRLEHTEAHLRQQSDKCEATWDAYQRLRDHCVAHADGTTQRPTAGGRRPSLARRASVAATSPSDERQQLLSFSLPDHNDTTVRYPTAVTDVAMALGSALCAVRDTVWHRITHVFALPPGDLPSAARIGVFDADLHLLSVLDQAVPGLAELLPKLHQSSLGVPLLLLCDRLISATHDDGAFQELRALRAARNRLGKAVSQQASFHLTEPASPAAAVEPPLKSPLREEVASSSVAASPIRAGRRRRSGTTGSLTCGYPYVLVSRD